MLDLNLIRENPEKIKNALLKRMDNVDFTELLQWDKDRRELIANVDGLKNKQNTVSKQIPVLKKQGKDVTEYYGEMKNLSNKIKELDQELNAISDKIQTFMAALPNLPDDDVVAGGKENNKPIREWGKKLNLILNSRIMWSLQRISILLIMKEE